MKKYMSRFSDKILLEKLEGKGAVLIEGPKWCGKTTTAEHVASSILYMDEPEMIEQNLRMATLNPKMLLEGAAPRLIDEWQLAPKLWDAVRFEVDHRENNLGQFILTGSAVPADSSQISHSGTGRFAWMKMRTMSLFESGDSNGSVSLSRLFDAPEEIEGSSEIDMAKLAFLVCRGGWPQALFMKEKIALNQARDYYDALIHEDINRADGIKKSPERVQKLMRSYARNQGAQVSNSAISKDIAASGGGLNEDTVAMYLDALRKIFVVEDMPAWSPNLRSKTAIRTADTRYFIDPSIAAAALGAGPDDLITDLNSFGFLFETLCARDLRVYADALDGKVYHFRAKSGLECDAVLSLRNGNYGLIEIKLGGEDAIEEASASLKKTAGLIDSDRMKSPAFLMVLSGLSSYAYRREDGVYVVPIGCLRA